MKIRYAVVLYTFGILFFSGVIMLKAREADTYQIDLAGMNERKIRAEAAIESGASILRAESDYGCIILLRTDDSYESRWMEAVKDGDVVLDYMQEQEVIGKIVFTDERQLYEQQIENIKKSAGAFMVLALTFGYGILIWVHRCYVRPFRNLQHFAADVSRGNLDMPLTMTKNNYFGAFTESFDIMREELKKAKENEYLANISKKELVAGLSHDVKTPVATIKATCEVLTVKKINSDTLQKVEIITKKADMIESLVGNMFHATMEELEALKVEPREESSEKVVEMLMGFCDFGKIEFENKIPGCLLSYDSLRLNQVIDNIIHNSFKNAGTPIRITFREEKTGVRVIIRDYGSGVLPEELVLLTEKFYRGSNAKGKSGSGLGLHLSLNFMKSMGGEMECYCENGFVVNLFIKKAVCL